MMTRIATTITIVMTSPVSIINLPVFLLYRDLAAAGFGQRDAGGAQGAILRLVSLRYGAEAAEKGDAEVVFFLRAVDQDTYAGDLAVLASNQLQDLADGLAGGEYVIDDKDLFAGVNNEASPKNTPVFAFLFGEYAAYSHLPGNLVGEDDAAGGRPGYDIDVILGEVVTDKAAQLLGVVGKLEYAELLPVDRGM
jgi:hypothetical protein